MLDARSQSHHCPESCCAAEEKSGAAALSRIDSPGGISIAPRCEGLFWTVLVGVLARAQCVVGWFQRCPWVRLGTLRLPCAHKVTVQQRACTVTAVDPLRGELVVDGYLEYSSTAQLKRPSPGRLASVVHEEPVGTGCKWEGVNPNGRGKTRRIGVNPNGRG